MRALLEHDRGALESDETARPIPSGTEAPVRKLTLSLMKAIAKTRGGLCLSETYEHSKIKLRWRCSKRHEWEALPSSVKAGSWCRQCAVETIANRRRIPLAEVQRLAASKGGECLSTEYLGNKNDKLRWRCGAGHEWMATLGHVRNDDTWCRTCAQFERRLSLDALKDMARTRGGECLSAVYHGQDVKLRWRCAKGHEWDAAPGHIMNQGCWCPKCAGTAPRQIEEMHAIARSKGGECLSATMKNAHTRLRWRCVAGHEWMAAAADITSGHWCRKCAAKSRAALQRTSMAEIQSLARSRGGSCLSSEYVDSDVNLRWRCARGHEWLASLRNVKHNKSGCPVCGAGVSERICRGIFEALFRTRFDKSRPKWLRNERGHWMELDGFAPALNLAFEYHGVQHYKRSHFFHGSEEEFRLRQRDDRKRLAACKKRGITLIEVPFDIPHGEMENFIRVECARAGIAVPRVDRIEIEALRVYDDNPLDDLRSIARAKGGLLLSTMYINRAGKLHWQCREGHEWKAPASAIKVSGQWCPICGIRRRSDAQRLTIEDMRSLAKLKGGHFVSEEYKGVRFKHRWRCADGHEWDAVPQNVKTGAWCPHCAGLAKGSIEEMQALAESYGGTCLSALYVNCDARLRWRCARGHVFEATPYKVKHRGSWCRVCPPRSDDCRSFRASLPTEAPAHRRAGRSTPPPARPGRDRHVAPHALVVRRLRARALRRRWLVC